MPTFVLHRTRWCALVAATIAFLVLVGCTRAQQPAESGLPTLEACDTLSGKRISGCTVVQDHVFVWTQSSVAVCDPALNVWHTLTAERSLDSVKILSVAEAGENICVITKAAVFAFEPSLTAVRRIANVDLAKWTHVETAFHKGSNRLFIFGGLYRPVSFGPGGAESSSTVYSVDLMHAGLTSHGFPGEVRSIAAIGNTVLVGLLDKGDMRLHEGLWKYDARQCKFEKLHLTFPDEIADSSGETTEKVQAVVGTVEWAWSAPASSQALLFGTEEVPIGEEKILVHKQKRLMLYDMENGSITPLNASVATWGQKVAYDPLAHSFAYAVSTNTGIDIGTSDGRDGLSLFQVRAAAISWKMSSERFVSAAGRYSESRTSRIESPERPLFGFGKKEHILLCRGIAAMDGTIYFGSNIGLFIVNVARSTVKLHPVLAGKDLTCVAYQPRTGDIFIGTGEGLYRAKDGKPAAKGMAETRPATPEEAPRIVEKGRKLTANADMTIPEETDVILANLAGTGPVWILNSVVNGAPVHVLIDASSDRLLGIFDGRQLPLTGAHSSVGNAFTGEVAKLSHKLLGSLVPGGEDLVATRASEKGCVAFHYPQAYEGYSVLGHQAYMSFNPSTGRLVAYRNQLVPPEKMTKFNGILDRTGMLEEARRHLATRHPLAAPKLVKMDVGYCDLGMFDEGASLAGNCTYRLSGLATFSMASEADSFVLVLVDAEHVRTVSETVIRAR